MASRSILERASGAAIVAPLLLGLVTHPVLCQSPPPPPGIDHHNRLLLVRAEAEGKRDAIVLVATAMGATETVAEEVRRLGGEVRAVFSDVGYLRARLPVAQLPQLAARSDVLEARIDGGGQYYAIDMGIDPHANDGWDANLPTRDTSVVLPPVPPEALTAESPYVPTGDMGIPRFRRAHPTFDGRGVTIAIVEGGSIAFSHPALQFARQLNGDSTIKLRGIIDPAMYEPAQPADSAVFGLKDPDLRRIQVAEVVQASEGTARFSFHGHTYWAPRRGRFAVGEYVSGGYPDANGNWKGDSIPYVVLWDSATRTAWVDTRRDRDFRHEQALRDINDGWSLAYLQRDSVPGQTRDSIPFVVAFDSVGGGVRLYEGNGSWAGHATMVASVASGHRLLGGEADGAAPAAQVILSQAGPGLGGFVEAFIRAARDPRVDLLTCSQYDGNYPNAGESILPLIQGRLVERYHKPIFAAADNSGPSLGLTSDQSNSPAVISVGAYVAGATYRAQYGWPLSNPDGITAYSARGPAANGAAKPDLLAPALGIAAAPCDERDPREDPVVYKLPPCYMLSGGTSAATPAAAGAAALLVSAAKQQHLAYDARRIAWAMREGARTLPGYGVHEQGHGLVNVPHAWELLQRAPEPPHIVSAAAVRGEWSQYLRTPGAGAGLYEREGWAAGDRRTRTITLTRTSGSPTAMHYRLRWRGNDGTFAAPNQVRLALSRPAAVPVQVAPRAPGVHSAMLEVIDAHTGQLVHEVMATIVAAEALTAANRYTMRTTMPVPWPDGRSIFINVPPGTALLRLDLSVEQGRYSLNVYDPTLSAGFVPSVDPTNWFTYISAGHKGTRLIAWPAPGVWEVGLQPTWDMVNLGNLDSTQYHTPGRVTLTASASGLDQAAEVKPVAAGAGTPVAIAWTNRRAAIDSATVIAAIGTRRIADGRVDAAGPRPAYDIQVDSGASTLRVDVTPADTAADLDLYLFDCSQGPCYLANLDHSVVAHKALLMRSPRPGRWKAVIDPARLSAGSAAYAYTEIQTGPKYGTATASAGPTARPLGATWRDSLVIGLKQAPPNGAELVAVADLVDQAAEEAERARPLATFRGAPYRPVVLGTIVVPLTVTR